MLAEKTDSQFRRTIESFVRRNGRITKAQKEGLERLLPRYAIQNAQTPLAERFACQQPLVLEIGFGMGESLLEMAKHTPDNNFIGAEVYEPGVGRLAHEIDKNKLNNLKIYHGNVMHLLQSDIPNGALSKIQIFFPDPWHKKRHHKRRLINDAFLVLIADKLQPGGIVHIATDWAEYADWIEACFNQNTRFILPDADKIKCTVAARCATKFEARGKRLGHQIFDFVYQLPICC